MANPLKSLVKDTAIYGLSTIGGKFLNWLLTAIYSRVLLTGEFGQMTLWYSAVALLLIVLTYGMETSFFRFANTHEKPDVVFSTAVRSIGLTSLLFVLGGLLSLDTLAELMAISTAHTELVVMLLLIVALDAFTAIPLGYLRYAQRPWWFMAVRMGFIALTVLLTLLVFVGFPWLQTAFPDICSEWYRQEYALHYILGINLVGNVVQLLMLLPVFRHAKAGMDWALLRQMLGYGWPILLLGLVGAMNNHADKLLVPQLFDDPAEGRAQLGIYSACYKIAVIMVLFTQAFRYAYDPFVFAKSKEGGEIAKRTYADSMKYYVLFTLFIFLAVMSFMDILQHFVGEDFRGGIVVVPWIMAGQLMFGVYFNLSLWYKLTNRTHWGAILSLVGCAATILIIVWGVPRYGIIASAWASVISNALIMLLSYFLGQKYYPINYDLRSMLKYTALVAVLMLLEQGFASWATDVVWLRLAFNSCACMTFVWAVAQWELPKGAMQRIMQQIGRRL